MDCSLPGFPIHHQLPDLAQTHVHRVMDAIQLSHPLSSPSPPIFNLSQHQGLFQWVSSSNQLAKVLEFQLQHQSFQWIFRDWFPLGWTGLMSLQSKGLSRVFSNTTVQKHQFFSAQLSLWSNSHIDTCEKVEFKAKASLWEVSRGAGRRVQGWGREGVEQWKRVFLRRRSSPSPLIPPFGEASCKGSFKWLHLRKGWLSREGMKEKASISWPASSSSQLFVKFTTFT